MYVLSEYNAKKAAGRKSGGFFCFTGSWTKSAGSWLGSYHCIIYRFPPAQNTNFPFGKNCSLLLINYHSKLLLYQTLKRTVTCRSLLIAE